MKKPTWEVVLSPNVRSIELTVLTTAETFPAPRPARLPRPPRPRVDEIPFPFDVSCWFLFAAGAEILGPFLPRPRFAKVESHPLPLKSASIGRFDRPRPPPLAPMLLSFC